MALGFAGALLGNRYVLIAAAAAACFWAGHRVAAGGYEARLHAQSVKAAAQQRAQQTAVDQLAEQLESARAEQRPRDRVITQEVVRYVEIPSDRRCELDGAWRVLHDAAATGQPPEPSGVAAGSAPPVADAAALETVAGNYEQCRGYIEQINGWRAWWERVKPRQ